MMTDARGGLAHGEQTVPDVPGYRIERQLGRGSMGVVYLAEDVRLRRKVALKILAPTLADDELFRARFDRESQSAATLDHPNIVPIYAAGEAGGLLYIAMRYLGGGDLKALIENNGPLSLEQAVSAIASVAEALDAAHAQGMIHRDVKPANILIDARNGQEHYYLSDFGITKIVSSGRSLTSTGQIVGTVGYLAPEQIQGKPVDGRADLYALGCVLYHCLTGTVPFPREETAALMWAHVYDEPPPVTDRRPDLPPQIDHIVAMTMAKQPEERYGSCRELALALRGLTDTPVSDSAAPVPAQPIASPPPPYPTGKLSTTPGPSGRTGTYVPPVLPRVRTPPAVTSQARKWWLTAACAAVALAVIAGATMSVLEYFGSRFPNAAEQELLGEVPLALTMKNSCTRNEEAEQDTINVAASVVCTSDDDVNKIVFTKFTSPQALEKHYQAAVARAGVGAGSGDCRSAEQAEGTYSSDSGRTTGRSLCYQQRGSSFVEWTDEGSRTLAEATRADPDYGKLRGWWDAVVGVKTPTTPSSAASQPAAPPEPPAPPLAAPAVPREAVPAPDPAPDSGTGSAPGAGEDSKQQGQQRTGQRDSAGGVGGNGGDQPTTPSTTSEPPTTTTTPPPTTTTTPPPTTPPPTTQKPPGELAGPAPAAPSAKQSGRPVAGKGGCTAVAGPRYVCTIVKGAPVYLPGKTERSSSLRGNQSEFLCQSDGSKYTFGNRTNHWWAWVSNVGGWVPVAYLAGDPSNAPEPGLPVCGSTPTTTTAPTTTHTPHTPPTHPSSSPAPSSSPPRRSTTGTTQHP
jgi:serine/threonine protein kinase